MDLLTLYPCALYVGAPQASADGSIDLQTMDLTSRRLPKHPILQMHHFLAPLACLQQSFVALCPTRRAPAVRERMPAAWDPDGHALDALTMASVVPHQGDTYTTGKQVARASDPGH